MARTGRSPSGAYGELTREVGGSVYARIDAPATAEEKRLLQKLSAADVTASTLAGDPIQSRLTTAPGNGASIGGLTSGDRARMVCCAAIRHGGRLRKPVRGKFSG